MKEFFGKLWMFAVDMVAIAIFVALVWFFARAHSHMWRKLAGRYSGPRRSDALSTKLEAFVITDRPPAGRNFRNYGGLMMAIHQDGLSAWMIPPLNIMTKALFLPFNEMKLAETDWGLWDKAYAIRMSGAPDLDIVITKRTLDWIRAHIDAPPFGLAAWPAN